MTPTKNTFVKKTFVLRYDNMKMFFSIKFLIEITFSIKSEAINECKIRNPFLISNFGKY